MIPGNCAHIVVPESYAGTNINTILLELLSACTCIPTERKPVLNSEVQQRDAPTGNSCKYACASMVLIKGAWPKDQLCDCLHYYMSPSSHTA